MSEQLNVTLENVVVNEGGTTDFDELENRPKYNGIEMTHSTNIPEVPTELADLTDDTTHRVVTDTEKTAWNAKANTDDIPTTLADLTGDTTHRTVTDTEKTAWNAKADVDDIPTKTSDLTNDSGFITNTKIFVATYGTTTAAEVAAALTLGKAVVCEYIQDDVHCQMLLETESDSKYTFVETGVSTYNNITSVYGHGAALNKATSEWQHVSGSGTILTNAEQITYDSTLETHEAGSVGAQLASQSSQIETLDDEKEDKGKMTVGSTEYSVTRKALVITDGSTTTTYYVADITA